MAQGMTSAWWMKTFWPRLKPASRGETSYPAMGATYPYQMASYQLLTRTITRITPIRTLPARTITMTARPITRITRTITRIAPMRTLPARTITLPARTITLPARPITRIAPMRALPDRLINRIMRTIQSISRMILLIAPGGIKGGKDGWKEGMIQLPIIYLLPIPPPLPIHRISPKKAIAGGYTSC